jgi:CDP-diglyceride synthetase
VRDLAVAVASAAETITALAPGVSLDRTSPGMFVGALVALLCAGFGVLLVLRGRRADAVASARARERSWAMCLLAVAAFAVVVSFGAMRPTSFTD